MDLGAISDGTFHTAQKRHGNILTILAQSAPIPLDAIVARADLPPALGRTITEALAAMPADHAFCQALQQSLGWHAAGFAIKSDSFYDSLREALGR